MKKCSAIVLAGIMLFKAGLSTNIFAADNSSDSEFSVKSGLSTVKKVNTAFEYVKRGMLGFLVGVVSAKIICGVCESYAKANSPRSSHNNSQRSFFADSDGTCDLGEPGTFRVNLDKFSEFEEEVNKVLRFINDSNNSGEAKACEIAKLENYFYKEVVTEFGVDGRAYSGMHDTIDNHSNISFSGKISGAYFNRNIFSKVRQLASKMQSCRGSDKAQRLFWAFQSIKNSLRNQANSSHICP